MSLPAATDSARKYVSATAAVIKVSSSPSGRITRLCCAASGQNRGR